MAEEEPRLLEIGAYTFRLTRNPDGTYKSEALPHLPNAEIPLIPPFGKGKVLGIFESESNPGEKHYVILSPSGNIYCTCYGFRSPNKCWHYRGMMETLKEIPIGKIVEPIKIGFSRKEAPPQ
jgi:hypothetical protein